MSHGWKGPSWVRMALSGATACCCPATSESGGPGSEGAGLGVRKPPWNLAPCQRDLRRRKERRVSRPTLHPRTRLQSPALKRTMSRNRGNSAPWETVATANTPSAESRRGPRVPAPPPQILSTPGWQIDEEELGLEKGLQPSGARSGQRAQH